jgi:uncharacterized protein YjbI with pentapeptide repeats
MPTLRSSKEPSKEPDPPRLPSSYKAFDDGDIDGAYQMHVQGPLDADWDHAEIEQCRFTKADFSSASGAGVTLVDCMVEQSDLANVAFEGSGLRRVVISDSRLTGLSFLDGMARDVVVRESKVDLTNWRATTFTTVHFVQCDLTRADFAMADLRGAQFTDCVLTGAQFSNAKLAGARFAGCDLTGIGGMASFAGAIIRSDDLFALTALLADALGIAIEHG